MARVHAETFTTTITSDHERNCIKQNALFQRDVISVKDFSLQEIELILQTARRIKQRDLRVSLQNKIIAHCFFEASTRTRLSFETATLRAGGQIIGFDSDKSLSIQKGETLLDTVRVIANYADLLVIRHPQEGSARLAAQVSDKPVINAGDGANQHPTQALLDLFTIEECQGKINGLSIALVGDLKYARTMHSLAHIFMMFDIRLYLVANDGLSLPDDICDNLKREGIRFSFHQTIEEVIPRVDIIYMTRVQQERIKNPQQFETSTLTREQLANARPNLKILHPLPRVNQIDFSIDETPYAYYFQQAANGIYVRQALLSLLLNEELA